jgi:hypothetical protein
VLLHQAVPEAVQVEACFQQALDIARRQEAKFWELRAATGLARLWQQQDSARTPPTCLRRYTSGSRKDLTQLISKTPNRFWTNCVLKV